MRGLPRVLVALALLLLLSGGMSLAEPLRVAWNVDIHQDKFADFANDFHIWGILESGDPSGANPPTFTQQVNFIRSGPGQSFPGNLFTYQIGNPVNRQLPGNYPGPNPPLAPFYYFDANWTGGNIPFCTWVHFGLEFQEECHNVGYWLQGTWTKDGVDPMNVPILGFDVDDLDERKITIQNASGSDNKLEIVQMQLMSLDPVAGQAFPLADLNTNYFTEHAGEYHWSGVPSNMLPSKPLEGDGGVASFFDVFFDLVLPDPLGPSEVLIARQQVRTSTGDLFWEYELHEAHIPEPFSVAFMASAFVGVVACRLRKRRKEANRAA